MSTSFYIWITVFIIIILLLSASAISKIAVSSAVFAGFVIFSVKMDNPFSPQYDKRVRARRTLVSRQVDVETGKSSLVPQTESIEY